MRIITVEDEYTLLKHLTKCVREVLPEADVFAFENSDDVLASLQNGKTDMAFLDIEIGDMNGLELAKKIKSVHPDCDIIFCTGYSSYATQAFDLGASDYLMKPITKEKIQHALTYLRHNTVRRIAEEKLYIRCFGEFEVFYEGEPVASFTKRAKELLAFLVDRAGALCDSTEIKSTVFYNNADSYLRVAKKDLEKTLAEIGAEDILIKRWGHLGIKKELTKCDYFEYLNGEPGALNLYKGAYMLQYDWAKPTLLRLNSSSSGIHAIEEDDFKAP